MTTQQPPNPHDPKDKSNDITDAAQENLEYILDGFTKFVLDGHVSEGVIDSLSAIPVVKNVAAVLAIIGTFRNRFVAKKIAVFIDTVQAGAHDPAAFRRLRDKYGEERILEEVMNRIDRLRSEMHAEIYAHLYRAVVDESIEWTRFVQIADAIEVLSTTDIDDEQISNPVSGPSFTASGLAYLYYDPKSDRMLMAKNGTFYNDFWEFGLKHYKASHQEQGKSS